MSRLIIKNFGPIRDLNLEIKDLLVLVGPQAGGKSTVAKLVYFFLNFRDEYIRYCSTLYQSHGAAFPYDRQRFFDHQLTAVFHRLKLGRPAGFGVEEFEITYEFGNGLVLRLQSEYLRRGPNILLNDRLERELSKVESAIRERMSSRDDETTDSLIRRELDRREVIDYIEKTTQALFGDDRELVFIPAGRSLLSVLTDQLHRLSLPMLDVLLERFVQLKEELKDDFRTGPDGLLSKAPADSPEPSIELAFDRMRAAVGGVYRFDRASNEDRLYLGVETEQFVKMDEASSGQQEAAWLMNVALWYLIKGKRCLFVVEEPEAHLFPEAQKQVVEMLALLFNRMEGNGMIITTHSPYVLASLNNLLLAHAVGTQPNNPVISSLRIAKESTGAWLMENGTGTDILDDELPMIRNEVIDEVAGEINKEFDRLLPLLNIQVNDGD